MRTGAVESIEIKTETAKRLLYSFTLNGEARIWFSQGKHRRVLQNIYLGDNDLTPRIKLVTPVLPEEGELQIDSNQSATLNIVNHSLLFSVKVRYAIALIS